MNLVIVTHPASEPITREEAKTQLRVDIQDDNLLIDRLIQAAREHTEAICNKAIMAQTWDLRLDYFPSAIQVPRPPLQSVTEIVYTDTNGTEQTLDAGQYQVDSYSEPGMIYPAYNVTWPDARDMKNAVRVQFVAGYSSVPESLKQAMLMLIGHLYENRELSAPISISRVPFAYDALIANYRTWL